MNGRHASAPRRLPWRALLVVATASIVLLGAVVYMQQSLDVPMGTLTQDPLARRPAYTGFLSQAGILLWAAAAAVCGLTAAVLNRRAKSTAAGSFFGGAAVLTLFLCLDDAFMLHDAVLPDQFGVPEEIVYSVYVGLLLVFLLTFRRHILRTDFVLLAIAFVFFGVSIIADTRGLPGLDPFLLEDGAKAIGILSWLTYFFREGAIALGSDASG